MASTNEFKVPLDSQLGELKGGRPLVPGETIELTAEEVKNNQELIDEGRLLAIESKSTKGGDK